MGLQAGTSAPNTTRATTFRPGYSEQHMEIKANLWKSETISLQKEPRYLVQVELQSSRGITKGHSFVAYLVTSMWRL